jgi:SPP1 gp7 family putative phage head morphogenesis protein
MAQMMSAYQDVLERLNPLIELAQQQALADGVATPAELFRLERWQELQRQTAVELERLAQITGDVTTEAQARAVRIGLDDALGIAQATARGVQAQASITAAWAHLPTTAVEDLVGLANNGPLRSLLDTFGDDGMRIIADELVKGLALGQSPRTVARSIEQGLEISRNRALTITRTESLRAMRSATLRSYAANADILRGYRRIAAHQTRTCLACLALDGVEYPITYQFFPSHPNCRCSLIPVLRNLRQRSYQDGESWLEGQPIETQQAMIPNALWDDYAAGRITLPDFVFLDESPTWGPSYREATISEARANAERRERRAA